MPISKLRPAFTFTEDRLRELQAVVPEAFADGKINWDTLREALGETLEDEAQEHFGLFWPGKREARRLAAMPSKGTLIPEPGAGVDEDNTHNLFIEGDNLEVLKLLQKSYAGRVKMIYIDPPYNTGGDFIYPDDYSEPLETYLRRTGQIDEFGQTLSTNTRASGRYHSNWINMIYPRLLLARQLLRDDGVVFVSIDDNEVHHLRSIMDEIFGQENFEGHIHWRRRHNQPNDKTKMIALVAEHIISYAKNSQIFKQSGVGKIDITGDFSNPDNDPKGDWASKPWKVGSDQSGSRYVITTPTGKTLDEEWMGDDNTYKALLNDGRILFPKKGDGYPRKKYYRFEREEEGQCATNWWTHEDFGHNQGANDEMTRLFGVKNIFSNPKPFELIRGLIQIANVKEGDWILDFFAGSCSTAQAVMENNKEEMLTKHFIMVQLPEPIPSNTPARIAGYKTISEIGKERIRKVYKKLSDKTTKNKIDLGFNSFALAASHFTSWELFEEKNIPQLEMRFGQAETPLVEGWQPKNLLAEILLLHGFPLDSKVNSLPEFKANEVQQVTSEFIGHHVYVCLDKKVKTETVAKINLRPEDILVCLDSALSDEAKVKLADQCNLKVI